MTSTRPVQRAFSSGEVSPALHFRPDYLRAQTGLRTCRGFLPLVEGGITRAPGTNFRGRTKSDARPRLIAFQFAADDALVLEFTPGAMRVWRYGALVMSGGAPYELATPFDAASIKAMSCVQSADVIYIADGRRPIQRLARYGLADWTIGPAPFTGPFMTQNLNEGLALAASAAAGIVTLTATGAVFLPEHVGAQFHLAAQHYTDIPIWTGNTTMPLGQLTRYDGNIYRLVRPAEPGDTDRYIIGSVEYARTGSGTIDTGVNPPVHTEGTWRTSTSPAVYWEFVSDGKGIVRIDAVASPTSATATVLRALPPNITRDPTYRWSEGAWSNLRGWPSSVEIHEQRMLAAGTPSEPRTIWFSVTGDYADFSPGVEADDAFAYAIAGQASLNRIISLKSGRSGLHVFGLGQEFSTRADGSTSYLSATSTVIRVDSSNGAAATPPIAPDGDPIFISRDQRRVIRIAYSLQDDANRPADLSRAAQHFGADGFAEIAWQSTPQRIAWARALSGDLLAMLYEPAEEVIGWARVPVAGGRVVALAVTPAAAAGLDTVTIAVERKIGEQTVCMIEELSDTYSFLIGATDLFTVNHFFASIEITADDPRADFDLSHLIGQPVHAWTDGGEFGPIVVPDSGTVTLPAPASRGFIGLFDDTHVAETLDLVAQSPNGDTSGRKRRIKAGVGVSILNSAAGYLRAVERDLAQSPRLRDRRPIVPRSTSSDLSQVFSGVAQVDAHSGSASAVSLQILPHGGAPLTVTSITPALEVSI